MGFKEVGNNGIEITNDQNIIDHATLLKARQEFNELTKLIIGKERGFTRTQIRELNEKLYAEAQRFVELVSTGEISAPERQAHFYYLVRSNKITAGFRYDITNPLDPDYTNYINTGKR